MTRRTALAIFELQGHGGTAAVYEVSGPSATIGRSGPSSIRLDDLRVSRMHAHLEWLPDGSIVLMDMSSHGGTWVDGRRLTPHQPVALRDWCKVCIVDHVFVFHRKFVEREESNRGDGQDATVASTVAGTDDRFLVLYEQSPLAGPCSEAAPGSGDESTQSFRQLLEAGNLLGRAGELEQMLDAAIAGLMNGLPAAEGVAFLLQDRQGIGFMYGHGCTKCDQGAFRTAVEIPFVRRAFGECQALLVTGLPIERLPDEHGRPRRDRVAAWFCVPLTGLDGQPTGILLVSSKPFEPPFSAAQLRRAMAGQDATIDPLQALPFQVQELQRVCRRALPIGWALAFREAAHEASTRICREIVDALPSANRPALPGYSLDRLLLPGHDFQANLCEFVSLERNRGVVVLVDVPDGGIKGALTLADVYLEIRARLHQRMALGEVLLRVDRLLRDAQPEGPPVSVVLAEIDGDIHRLTVLKAGDHPVFVARANNGIETLKPDRTDAAPLGAGDDPVFGLCTTQLEPGDWTLLAGKGIGNAREFRLLTVNSPGEREKVAGNLRSALLDSLRRRAVDRRRFPTDVAVCVLSRDGEEEEDEPVFVER
jgi:hypothetical protein